jgi:phosphoribosylformylglycinamidine synthase PurS subunit
MAEYKADIRVMLKRAILDPQGRAVETALHRLGTQNVSDVRIGKHIELTIAGEHDEVEAQLETLIAQILSNPVMEEATYTLNEAVTEEAKEAVPAHAAE